MVQRRDKDEILRRRRCEEFAEVEQDVDTEGDDSFDSSEAMDDEGSPEYAEVEAATVRRKKDPAIDYVMQRRYYRTAVDRRNNPSLLPIIFISLMFVALISLTFFHVVYRAKQFHTWSINSSGKLPSFSVPNFLGGSSSSKQRHHSDGIEKF